MEKKTNKSDGGILCHSQNIGEQEELRYLEPEATVLSHFFLVWGCGGVFLCMLL